MTQVGLSINKTDLKRLVQKLHNLPKGVRRNAATSALNAGARVIRDDAKALAPACVKPTIKNVRLKQRDGYVITAIAAGVGQQRPDSGLLGSFNNATDAMFGKGTACVANWYEFGTYGNRDYEGSEPYAPSTLKKKSYRSGRSNSPYWAVRPMWVRKQPFMRPALQKAMTSGEVEKAMAKKLDEYFKKLEAKK
jgi:HK97 gp10 family phage protein